MHEEDEMAPRLAANDIRGLGFDWPKYVLIEEYSVIEDGKVDLTRTIEGLQSSRALLLDSTTYLSAINTW